MEKEKLMKSHIWITKVYMYFICASVIGWIYEVLIVMFENHNGFQNRGMLIGPYLPIYGFGMWILMITVNPIRKVEFKKISLKSKRLEFIIKLILAFIAAFVITTLVELIGSYIINPTSWDNGPWYYGVEEGYKINFQGRIALKSSLRFGAGSLFLLYVLQPFIDKFSEKRKLFTIVSSTLLIVFLIDSIVTFVL